MNVKRKILFSHFRYMLNASKYLCFVAAQTDEHLPEDQQTWQAYVFVVDNENDKEADEQNTANYGAKLFPNEAKAFFPHLDIKKYKL